MRITAPHPPDIFRNIITDESSVKAKIMFKKINGIL